MYIVALKGVFILNKSNDGISVNLTKKQTLA